MNKRIQELAEQANAWYPGGYPSGEGGDKAWKNVVIFQTEEDLQKFAELIVKECIEISHVGSSTEDKIKKHFGVEE